MNTIKTTDVRIKKIDPLKTPAEINALYPITSEIESQIATYRFTVNNIIKGEDKRMLAIVGPCSIHDVDAAIEYAKKLKKLSEEVGDVFYVVMRTYFEKPRTIGGWKGLILDPDMDDSYDIQKGLETARSLLLNITKIGLPVGCEMLDPIIPQYIDDLMSWISIGARTTESQTHRHLASGLSAAIGFKNSTSGDLSNAVNAVKSARAQASFIGIDKEGNTSIFRTTGNDCGHIILRGGDNSPNYYEDDVESAKKMMDVAGVNPAIVIDCSHANSRKQAKRQKRVLRHVIDQKIWGEDAIKGFMLESNLFEGAQKINCDLSKLEYGVSVTDECIGFEETEVLLNHAAELIRKANAHQGDIEIL